MPSQDLAGWLFAGVAILFMIWMALRAETRKARGVLETREERMLREIGELENTVATLLTKLNESQRQIEDLRQQQIRLQDAQREIADLRNQLKTANARIAELEIVYDIAPGQTPVRISPKRKLHFPLLVICGPDANIVGADLTVLNGIGIRYTRLSDATQSDVADTISQAREDGRLYRWLLISAHAGPEGIILKDGIAPADFWMRHLSGIEVVGIAACKGTNIADHLRDRAGFVWYFREDVPNEPANKFVQKFFQRLNAGETPETAFIACLDAVPEVAAYADYRTR
jgi:hypothetical protein